MGHKAFQMRALYKTLGAWTNQCQQVKASTVRFMVMVKFYFAWKCSPDERASE